MTEMIQDDSGNVSSSRVFMLITSAVVLGLIVYCAVTGKQLPELPFEYVALVIGAAGVKTWQKRYEAQPPKTQ